MVFSYKRKITFITDLYKADALSILQLAKQEGIGKWTKTRSKRLFDSARAKFYVALTRTRHSVAIKSDYETDRIYDGLNKYIPSGIIQNGADA